MAIGLAHVDEAPDDQSNHKADHSDENVEANCLPSSPSPLSGHDGTVLLFYSSPVIT